MIVQGEIVTFSGRRVRPLELQVEDVSIDDIAHALSQLCRFGGHTRGFYSVAQHSVLVADQVEAELPRFKLYENEQRALVLAALLHDATEAYLLDLPAPIKRLPELVAYRAAEARAEQAIAARFGLPYPMPVEVKDADAVLLITEQRDLMGMEPRDIGARPLPAHIHPLPPVEAELLFLQRFTQTVTVEPCIDQVLADAATDGRQPT